MAEFLASLGAAIQYALSLNPGLAVYVTQLSHANWLAFSVATLAGISSLVGQSAVLLANRVSPGRFVLSLLLNGLMWGIDLAVWSVSLWLVAGWVYQIEAPFRIVIRIIFLGSAPFVFGFLVLLPYLGPGIDWLLRIWSLLIILTAVRGIYPLTLWQALSCAIGGWLLIEALNLTLGRPLLWFRDWLWRTVTGSDYDQNIQAMVNDMADQLSEQLPARS